MNWLHCHTSWTEDLTLAACGQCWELRNGVSGIFCYYKSKIMVLHHSLYRKKEGILMEKIHLASSDRSNCPNGIPILYISRSEAENCMLCFVLCLKVNSSWFQSKKKKSPLLLHWNIWGSTPSTPWPKICHKDCWNKNRQVKSVAIPWIWKYFGIKTTKK